MNAPLSVEDESQINRISSMQLDDLIDFVSRELNAYGWMPGTEGLFPIATFVVHRFYEPLRACRGRLMEALRYRSQGDVEQATTLMESARTSLDGLYRKQGLPISTSPRAILCTKLHERSHWASLGAFVEFMGYDDRPAEMELASGAAEARLHEMGLGSAPTTYGLAFSRLRDDHSIAISTLNDQTRQANSMSESLLAQLRQHSDGAGVVTAELHARTNDVLSKAAADIAGALDAARAELSALKTTYESAMKLRAPVTYWTEQRKMHWWAAGISAFIFLVVSGLAVWATLSFIPTYLAGTSAPSDAELASGQGFANGSSLWRMGALLAAATVVLWGMRLLARFALSQAHSAMDASQRVTMTKTYLALLNEGGMAEVNSRELVLSALFRRSATGMIKDDGVPMTPMGLTQAVTR